jgi:hypothetical protein
VLQICAPVNLPFFLERLQAAYQNFCGHLNECARILLRKFWMVDFNQIVGEIPEDINVWILDCALLPPL